jgi:hypothetical protein
MRRACAISRRQALGRQQRHAPLAGRQRVHASSATRRGRRRPRAARYARLASAVAPLLPRELEGLVQGPRAIVRRPERLSAGTMLRRAPAPAPAESGRRAGIRSRRVGQRAWS